MSAVVVDLEGRPGNRAASAHAALAAEAVYEDLTEHVYECRRGCYPHRAAPWRRELLCAEGAGLVDDYAAAVLTALESVEDAGAALAVRLGPPGPVPRLVVL